MATSSRTHLRRAALCGLLCLSVFTVACSDDSGDDDAATESTTSGNDPWCDAVRSGQNVVPAERLEAVTEQAALAPESLAADYEPILELLEYQASNPGDSIGIADRTETAAEPFGRIVKAIEDQCDITIDLMG